MVVVVKGCLRIVLMLACMLACIALHSDQSYAATVKPKTIQVKDGDQIVYTPDAKGKPMACLSTGKQIMPGKASKNKKKFTPISNEYKLKIKELKLKIGAAKKINDLKAAAKYKKKSDKLKLELSKLNQGCARSVTIQNCTIEAQSQQHDVTENIELKINLSSTNTCPAAVTYEIMSLPSAGIFLKIDESTYSYEPEFFNGLASFNYRACVKEYNKCSAESTISINVHSGEFVGKNESLKRYKNTISRAEARHLLRKIALNDITLMPSGDSINLDVLVNRILDPEYVNPDLKKFLEQMRDGIYVKRGDGQGGIIATHQGNPVSHVVARDDQDRALYSAADKFSTPTEMKAALAKYLDITGKGYNPNIDWLDWNSYFSVPQFTVRSRYLSAVQARMTHLWAGHFGTSWKDPEVADPYFIRDNFSLLYDNSLSSFKRLILGITKDTCVKGGVGGGALCDKANNYLLNNASNTVKTPNQNFARELLELYLLGPTDLSSGAPNYDESDIASATAFVSGYKFRLFQAPQGNGANPATLRNRYVMEYDKTLHDFSEKTAFKNTPYEIKGAVSPVDFASHIIDKHPGSARFIAGKVFRMLAYPEPSEELIQQLADSFKKSNFDISKLIYDIASSQAMFSKKSYTPECVKSPWELMTENYRNLNFLIASPYYYDKPGEPRNGSSWSSQATLTLELSASGESLFNFPTVFSYQYCGRNPQAKGQVWINQVSLAQRTVALFKQINRAQLYGSYIFDTFNIANPNANVQKLSNYYDFANLVTKMLPPGTNPAALTMDKVIDYFTDLYGVKLSEQDRQIFLRYLEKDGLGGKVVWHGANKELMREKFAGLTILFSSLSQVNLR